MGRRSRSGCCKTGEEEQSLIMNAALPTARLLLKPAFLWYHTSMNVNYSHIAPRLRGQWVALAEDEATVLGSGKTAEEALAKAQKKRPETLIITHLPDEDEIPNDDLLAAMKAAEEEERSGKLTYYSTIDEMMAALE
jgi:hypothetical protein